MKGFLLLAFACLALAVPLTEDRFEEVGEVISGVVDLDGRANKTTTAAAPKDTLLEIYERWVRTRDAADERLLISAGVVLDPDGTDLLQ